MVVKWRSTALDRLAAIYTAEPTPDRREFIFETAHAINLRLADEAESLGESRGPNGRIWFHYPLVVGFTLPSGGGVVVFHVERLKDNSQNAS
jgi:hypothetical protein